MKFRCRMVDPNIMRDFTSIVSTISRMAKNCVLRLTPDELCFNIGDERIPVLWAVLSQQYLFTEYIMSGVSEQENEIYLEFDASMFARSLSSLRIMAKSVKIRLTNKRQPCLTFDIDLSSLSVDSRQCTHDVPVRVIPRKEWPEHKMPDVPEFDISLEIPNLKYLRCIVDRMKNMSSQLMIIANKSGTMILKIEVDYATVSTHFKGLQVWESREEQESNDISATEKMVKLTLDVGEYVKMHYFIPAIAS
ncbi:checkpoint protein HUS1 isoform X2 [Anoplolepis gracilipes]|uniref:checkpoint protein HUS1 isoform X2 n=1 Tax=Anoplolepis gracilipes TaxID=354296 RepID=UPI003B9F759F